MVYDSVVTLSFVGLLCACQRCLYGSVGLLDRIEIPFSYLQVCKIGDAGLSCPRSHTLRLTQDSLVIRANTALL